MALTGVCAVAVWVAHLKKLGTSELLPVSTSSFLATYILSMAAAMRLLRPPLSYAAAVSLIACLGVLFYVGPLLVWLGAVAAAALVYQWLAGARGRKLDAPG